MELGRFERKLEDQVIKDLNSVPNFELLGPSLRRANLFFLFKDSVICIYERGSNWLVLGEVYFTKVLGLKEQSIDREAAFQSLYHFSGELSKSLMGYYLERPILFKELKAHKLGDVYYQDLDDSYLVGESGEEHRRAKNLKSRAEDLEFEEVKSGELQSKEEAKGLYRRFLEKILRPYIGFLLAKTEDQFSEAEYLYLAKSKNKVEALISGFSSMENHFYVDRLARVSENRMLLDMLLVHVFEDLKSKGYKQVSLGLCSFYGSNKSFWKLFRSLIKFWYDADALTLFKSKYCSSKKPAYYFVESRKSHLLQWFKLGWNTIYFKL